MSISRRWGVLIAGALGVLFLPAAEASADDNSLGYNLYSVGIEGFRDRYREPEPDVTENANYGSLTGRYEFGGPKGFIAFDGRISHGSDDYSSPSGTINGIPQWETDLRARLGPTLNFWDGKISPYIGVGVRYFVDEAKGEVTNLNKLGYDRRITQFYIPIGATYSFGASDGWINALTLEIDPMVHGNVNTRLQNDGGYNVNNTQTSGYGLRGDYMIGQGYDGFAWQAGPFVRYWHISSSDVVNTPDLPADEGWEEPKNERLQTGVALRVLW